MNHLLLLIPTSLHFVFLIIGLAAFLGLVIMIYRMIVGPALKAQADILSPPLREGYRLEIVIDDNNRTKKLSIGQLDSEIKTRMLGVKEDHLLVRIVKDRDLEEYDFTVTPSGAVFYRRPHSKNLELMADADHFSSRELIGYPALFRITANIKNNRPLQYLDFELSTKFFINNVGVEKMKFILELKKIFPGVDQRSRTKKGLYSFGKSSGKEEVEPEEEI